MPLFNTKTQILVKLKGYPYGKNVKCHMWMEGIRNQEEIEKEVNENLKLTDYYKDYVLHEIKIINNTYTNTKRPEENFGELVLESISEVLDNKKLKGKVDIKDLNFSSLSVSDFETIQNTIKEELYRRENELSIEEYKFYKDNQNEIDIKEVKDIYNKFGGDIIKLKKEKIRKKIAEMQ